MNVIEGPLKKKAENFKLNWNKNKRIFTCFNRRMVHCFISCENNLIACWILALYCFCIDCFCLSGSTGCRHCIERKLLKQKQQKKYTQINWVFFIFFSASIFLVHRIKKKKNKRKTFPFTNWNKFRRQTNNKVLCLL